MFIYSYLAIVIQYLKRLLLSSLVVLLVCSAFFVCVLIIPERRRKNLKALIRSQKIQDEAILKVGQAWKKYWILWTRNPDRKWTRTTSAESTRLTGLSRRLGRPRVSRCPWDQITCSTLQQSGKDISLFTFWGGTWTCMVARSVLVSRVSKSRKQRVETPVHSRAFYNKQCYTYIDPSFYNLSTNYDSSERIYL